MVQIRVSEGWLEGETIQNKYEGDYYTIFKGIPYAEPPLGDLRFKAPQPPKPWQGVRSAKQFGPKCYQADWISSKEPGGSEDCLYLNVYTPSLTPKKPLPVMFWIHGGAYKSGSGEDDFYGPEFLVRKDVILVTINYRLEVLGFLCLDTADVPGNAGMKDQVQALRWVKENITSFGGDPNNVTIFGESVGGASVTFHLISPMSKGLFKRAIAQSGTCVNHWARGYKPKDRALSLARKLGFYSKNVKELYEFFKRQPIEKLFDAAIPVTLAEKAVIDKIDIYFGVVDEKQFVDNERFFYGDVIDKVCTSIHPGVDIMAGYNSDEGLVMLKSGDFLKNHLDMATNFPEYFVSKPLLFTLTMDQQLELGSKIREYYYGARTCKLEDWRPLVRFFTADMLSFDIMQWAKMCATAKKNKLFMYKFACKSERNMMSHVFGIEDIVAGEPVTNHMDELMYIFDAKALNTTVDVNSKTFELIDMVTELWTNFAKYGHPTPTDALGAMWMPYTIEEEDYMNIGDELTACAGPDREELQMWAQWLRQYGRKVL